MNQKLIMTVQSRFDGPDGQQFLGVLGSNLWLNFFIDYLNRLDLMLDSEAITVEDHYQGLLDKGKLGFTSRNDLKITGKFTKNLVYGFLFASAYSFAEAELVSWCEYFQSQSGNKSLSLKEIRASDQSLSKAMLYLEKVVGSNFPDLKNWRDWKELKDRYQPLRNRVVHAQATLYSGDRDKGLRKYINEHPRLSISKSGGLYGNDLIIFHQGFAQEAALNVRNFLMIAQKSIEQSSQKDHK